MIYVDNEFFIKIPTAAAVKSFQNFIYVPKYINYWEIVSILIRGSYEDLSRYDQLSVWETHTQLFIG